MTAVVQRTVADLEDQVDSLLADFPVLADIEAADCCPGCTTEEVRQVHGSLVASAWSELETTRWLLGED
jgi:hypothetical protein